MTHICIGNLIIIDSDNGLSPSHYLKQCWDIVNWTLGNNFQWNRNRNSNIFILENSFESIVCGTAAILSRPQRVNVSPALSDCDLISRHSIFWTGADLTWQGIKCCFVIITSVNLASNQIAWISHKVMHWNHASYLAWCSEGDKLTCAICEITL